MSILERLFWGCSRGVVVVAKGMKLVINKLALINEQVFFMFYIVVQRGVPFLFKLLNSSLG
jgi:hypothetical protein